MPNAQTTNKYCLSQRISNFSQNEYVLQNKFLLVDLMIMVMYRIRLKAVHRNTYNIIILIYIAMRVFED